MLRNRWKTMSMMKTLYIYVGGFTFGHDLVLVNEKKIQIGLN